MDLALDLLARTTRTCPDVARHSRAVAALAGALARRLGLSPAERQQVMVVALLHDVGKSRVPAAVLAKPGRLTEDEWRAVKAHAELGGELVATVPGLFGHAPAVRAVHERWDGGGYPDGLTGHAIPAAARIVAVCDAFVAMTEDRPYGRRLSVLEAQAELRRAAGRQLDPRAVAALLAHLGRDKLVRDAVVHAC